MALTDYTSYNAVRAAMGVSDEELDDDTLSLEMYSTGLDEDLYDVSATLKATYEGVAGKDAADRAEKEVRVYNLVRLFSTYSVARQLGSALPMFSPKSLSDGKASMSRFSGEPYKDVLKGLSEQYDLYRGKLTKALEDLASATTVLTERTYFIAASPIYDPVIGE